MTSGGGTYQHQRSYSVGSSTLTVRFGDLLESQAEVLVSSDDYLLTMGGGVSAAIARAGGNAIAIDAAKAIPLNLGDVVVTTAGALDARYVFHVVSIGPSTGSPFDASEGECDPDPLEIIRTATERCLSIAATLGVRSIAFPAIGAGVAAIDRSVVAAGMAEAIVDALRQLAIPMHVEIHLAAKRWQGEFEYIVFFEELAVRIKSTSTTPPPAANRKIDAEEWIEERRATVLDEAKRVSALEAGLSAQRTTLATNLKSEIVEAHAALHAALSAKPLRLFVSYSHADKAEAARFMAHLAGLRYAGLALWSDKQIDPGATWDDEISEALETAEIAVFLISSSFLDSPYCIGKEWNRSLQRRDAGELTMVPVILKASMWEPLVGHIQVLPTGGAPIMSQEHTDEAFLNVVKGIAEVIRQLRSGPNGSAELAD